MMEGIGHIFTRYIVRYKVMVSKGLYMIYCIELGKPCATIRSHECLLKLKISPPFGRTKLDTRGCGSA